MKPVHIVVLVLAGAVGGAVVMRVAQHRAPVPATAEQSEQQLPPPATSAAAAPAADAPKPAAQPLPAAEPAPPVEPVPAVRQPAPPPAKKPSAMVTSAPVRHAPPPANPRPLVVAQARPQASEPAPAAAAPPPPELPKPVPAAVPENAAPPAAPTPTPQPENVTPPAPAPTPHTVTLNAGMLIPVRLLDGLSSERNQPGDVFLASLDHELVADGFVIAERGARVEGRVVAADRGSKVNAGATLTVELIRLHTSDRQAVPVQTDTFEKRMQADRRQDVEKLAGGAALGAIIGALAGGGKGAAIGAGAGGGAGAGAVILTRKPATLPSETRISFRLRAPVTLTEKVPE